jgi:hypothetical protein
MNERPGWIQLLYERHNAWHALHSAFLLHGFKDFVAGEADAQPDGRGQLRQVALSELRSDDPHSVAMSLLFLGVVGHLDDLPAVETFITHPSDLIQKAARASLFELKRKNKSAKISGD